jgi:tRNA nucleotidyltransferase/poly(A) polymerase
MISARNLDDDPIRVLRAYRLAAELAFTIEARTRAALRRRVPGLKAEARERVHAELVRLFGAAQASRAIGWAERDGVIAAGLGLPQRMGRRIAPGLSPFDGLRRPEESRFALRMAALLFRWPVRRNELAGVLSARGFSRREIASIASGVGFLEAVSSAIPPERILYAVREEWPVMRALLKLAARGPTARSRARRFLSTARRCRFAPAPVNGRDIALWLGLTPGSELGARLDQARFLYFTGRARSRRDLEKAMRTFDPSGGVG